MENLKLQENTLIMKATELSTQLADIKKDIELTHKKRIEIEKINNDRKQIELTNQIDGLIMQLPFREELTYKKVTRKDTERERKLAHERWIIDKRNSIGTFCRYCREMDGAGGVPCSCNDI
jgi:hypothetical protein